MALQQHSRRAIRGFLYKALAVDTYEELQDVVNSYFNEMEQDGISLSSTDFEAIVKHQRIRHAWLQRVKERGCEEIINAHAQNRWEEKDDQKILRLFADYRDEIEQWEEKRDMSDAQINEDAQDIMDMLSARPSLVQVVLKSDKISTILQTGLKDLRDIVHGIQDEFKVHTSDLLQAIDHAADRWQPPENFEKWVDDIQKAMDANDKLRAEAESVRADLRVDLADAEDKTTELETELSQAHAKIAEQEAELSRTRERIAALDQGQKDHWKTIADQRDQILELENKLTTLEIEEEGGEIARLRNVNKAQADKLRDLGEIWMDKDLALHKAERRIRELEESQGVQTSSAGRSEERPVQHQQSGSSLSARNKRVVDITPSRRGQGATKRQKPLQTVTSRSSPSKAGAHMIQNPSGPITGQQPRPQATVSIQPPAKMPFGIAPPHPDVVAIWNQLELVGDVWDDNRLRELLEWLEIVRNNHRDIYTFPKAFDICAGKKKEKEVCVRVYTVFHSRRMNPLQGDQECDWCSQQATRLCLRIKHTSNDPGEFDPRSTTPRWSLEVRPPPSS